MKLNLQPINFNKKTYKPPKSKRFIVIDGEKYYITKENMRELGKMALESIKEEITQEKINEFIKDF